VGRTGDALKQIVTQVQEINMNVDAIVKGAREQATGIKEINEAVNTMDRGTQQNAAIAEQSTAASHSLATEVQALNQLLAQFKTSQAAQAVVAQRAPTPAPAKASAKPVQSPARQMVNKVARAFTNGNGSAAAANEWQDF
jgi:methyl-accepting chemotaxis protein